MSEDNVIKSITTHLCPHCGKSIFMESQMLPPVVNSIFTEEDVKKAKEDCLERIKTLSIDDDKKSAVETWLKNEDTVFGPNEVESIVLSLIEPKK